VSDKERRRASRLEQRRVGSAQRFTRRQQLMRKGLLAEARGESLPPQEEALYERFKEQDRREYETWWRKVSPECRQHIERVHRWTLARIRGEELEGPVPEGLNSEPGPGRPLVLHKASGHFFHLSCKPGAMRSGEFLERMGAGLKAPAPIAYAAATSEGAIIVPD
jgi:hypothetical protein